MTNLDSVLKSTDITLLTKVCIVKAMVFSIAMYRCESWTIKKAELLKNWCFWIVMLEKILGSPLDCKDIKPVNPKGNQPRIFTGRSDAEAPILWPSDAKSRLIEKPLMLGKTEGKRRRWQRIRWLDSITNWMEMNLSKLPETVKDRQAWRAAIHVIAESNMT